MTPTILLALARLANVEAQSCLERGQESEGLYLLDLHERIHQVVEAEYPEPEWMPGEPSHLSRASDWLASRAPSRSERPAQDCPPPADSWAVLGV